MRRALFAALFALLPFAAHGQQAGPAPGDDVIITIGGGPIIVPEYEGSKDYMLSAFPIIQAKFLVNPITGETVATQGFGIAPAFRWIDQRDGSTDNRLRGLKTIDSTLMAGVTVDYTWDFARVFATVLQGFGGTDGQVYVTGVDGIFRVMPGLAIHAGPRLTFASNDYMETYFSVSPKESKRTGFKTYQADGGLRSYGLGGRVDYEWSPQWLVRGTADWMRLAGDAADSPIVKNGGSDNQFSVGIGIAYRFGVDYR